MRNRIALRIAAVTLLLGPAVLTAQTVSTPLRAMDQSSALRLGARHPGDGTDPTRIGLLHVGGALGGIAMGTLADVPLRDWLQRHWTEGKDAVARVFRRMGQPEIYAPVGLGTVAVGLLSGNDRILRAGGRITASLMTSGATLNIIKVTAGRRRPAFADGPYDFAPFSGTTSWPSGHIAMAFALATSVADEVRSTPASIGLYAAATMTGWSRMNDNRHWFTDVVTGALLGMTSAKLMNGRWRVLGISAPHFLLEPQAEDTPLDPVVRSGAGLRLSSGRFGGVGGPRFLVQPGSAGVAVDF